MPIEEDFVQDQILRREWSVFPTVLRTAYAAVAELVKDTPMLQVESAEDNRGRLIAWAVDKQLVTAIENGSITCDYRWKPFAKPTGRYLEMRFAHSIATVSQTADPTIQPRNVVFRENARLNNQGSFDLPEFKAPEISGLPHILLIHGHKSLNFAHFGIPASDSKTKFNWRSTNLLDIPHLVEDDRPAPEHTDDILDEMNLLKEQIEKWRRDNGD
ncbi:hypothetical protein DL1_03145 [Thioclava dalianensis]|uniref:Uncharacterized protein n=1 Tax=Thioclava dalianensis TaxID=1185766 RepID=A0A074TD65_9RHOB|nr:hypothetical protein [Thioclava dalianensis]KEP69644.1 hypothetical protein DL1_03145 [Thioclava dalianensis]SFN15595.1 hypothetical protein SAMN05216224_102692 [Thioclava dalianensis]